MVGQVNVTVERIRQGYLEISARIIQRRERFQLKGDVCCFKEKVDVSYAILRTQGARSAYLPLAEKRDE